MPRKPQTTEQFIQKAHAVHGVGKYDYSKSIYVNNKTRLIITCPVHGDFEQAPVNHVFNNHNCPNCGHILLLKKLSYSSEDFIRRAISIHGYKYDYSLVQYTHSKSRVVIICSEHGAFEQVASTHLKGSGCLKCLPDRIADNNQSFIKKAIARHGNRYTYDKVVYKRTLSKVIITCPVHGDFEQKAASHLVGKGCILCARQNNKMSWLELAKNRISTLYLIHFYNKNESFFKVGITLNKVQDRYSHKAIYGMYDYEILAIHKSQNATAVWEWEQSILETFAHLTYRPKLNFPGATECFSSCDEILDIFPL